MVTSVPSRTQPIITHIGSSGASFTYLWFPVADRAMDDPGVQQQLVVIKELVGRADEVINCGDAGQEGNLSRWVLQMAECRVPVKRLGSPQ